jgi:hypothetical protein
MLTAQPDALDVAVEALLGVVTAAVDGPLIALALLQNFLDFLDERRALLRIEHGGGDPLWAFGLGRFRLATRSFFVGDFLACRLLGAFLVGLLLGGGVGDALGLLAGAFLVGLLLRTPAKLTAAIW